MYFNLKIRQGNDVFSRFISIVQEKLTGYRSCTGENTSHERARIDFQMHAIALVGMYKVTSFENVYDD